MTTARKATWLSLAAGLAAAIFLITRRTARRLSPLAARYGTRVVGDHSRVVAWGFDQQFRVFPAGKSARMELSAPAVVHWTANQWDTVSDTHTAEVGPNLHVADLTTEELPPGTRVQFTFYWPEVSRWEGEDFEFRVEPATGQVVRTATDKSG